MSRIEDIVETHARREGPLLPILHDVQAEFGHISDEAILGISVALDLTRVEVHGVASFYRDFKSTPDARPVIKLCRGEACQARGVDALLEDLPDQGGVKIEPVYCLGLCSVGPAAIVGDEVIARLDPIYLAALIEAVQ
jgi:formate dehydrogenase subunit gamma